MGTDRADIHKRIVVTRIYGRKASVYLEDGRPMRINAIGEEPAYPIGTVVVGRVRKMMDSSHACFVDIGDDTDYFLKLPARISDLTFTDGNEHTRIHPEDFILVQVASEGVKLKSPTVRGNISLKSRYAVIESGRGVSFSSRITADGQKSSLLPTNIDTYSSKYHIIVRTEAQDLEDPSELAKDLADLDACYEHIRQRSGTALYSNILYKPEGVFASGINEWLKYGCDEIVTDLEEYSADLEEISGARDIPFKYYDDEYPLCKLYKLETCVDECLGRRVSLKSGAYLVIEQGETLTAIDVNSGHEIRGRKEEAVFGINMEALTEIRRQLRLRNISGMILIDFINMKDPDHLSSLISAARDMFRYDDVPCRYVDMTGLGLMEVTRKRIKKSFTEQWKALN